MGPGAPACALPPPARARAACGGGMRGLRASGACVRPWHAALVRRRSGALYHSGFTPPRILKRPFLVLHHGCLTQSRITRAETAAPRPPLTRPCGPACCPRTHLGVAAGDPGYHPSPRPPAACPSWCPCPPGRSQPRRAGSAAHTRAGAASSPRLPYYKGRGGKQRQRVAHEGKGVGSGRRSPRLHQTRVSRRRASSLTPTL